MNIAMKPMNEMSGQELSELQNEKEKELRAAMESVNIIEQEDIKYAKEIAELQLKRKNLTAGLTQGKYNLRRISSEKREIERLMWQALRSERGF